MHHIREILPLERWCRHNRQNQPDNGGYFGILREAELVGETFIWRETGSGTREGRTGLFEKQGIQQKNTLEISSCEGVKRAVAAGLGLSMVSRLAIELELAAGILAIIRGESLSSSRVIHIIHRKDRRPSIAALAFQAYLHKVQHLESSPDGR